jgi:hypothetical protein
VPVVGRGDEEPARPVRASQLRHRGEASVDEAVRRTAVLPEARPEQAD